MKQNTVKTIVTLSNFGYIAACIVLYLIALCILVSAVYGIISDMTTGNYTVYKLLDEVGLIVFSMAVIDVGKYLMLEEVIRKGQTEKPLKETRKTLTKFGIIIATALSLEGLVLTIEVAKQDVTKILYPVSVLLIATIFIVGIGFYQYLSSKAEKL
ncbi:MAG: hypothetical protein H7A38_03200 [Chlamydiales bacterium]|nr:hypothetical protein [Chlamydiales bacterium]